MPRPPWDVVDEYACALALLDPTDETLEAYVALLVVRARAKVSQDRAEDTVWNLMKRRYA